VNFKATYVKSNYFHNMYKVKA